MGLFIAGRNIDDPMRIWRGYAHSYPRTIRDYDLGECEEPNRLTVDEAWRSRIINSRLSRSECEELVSRAAEPGCPWRDVTKNANLPNADPTLQGGDFDKAVRLYWNFTWPERIRGIRVAKAHKVLHIKRPALYPILDDKVRHLYRDSAGPWIHELGRLEVSPEDSPPYWAAIRQDLLCNEAQIDRYRDELATDTDKTVALMARLTNLRLQDIIAWQIAG